MNNKRKNYEFSFIKKIFLFFITLTAILYSLSTSIDRVTKDKEYYFNYSKDNNLQEYVGENQDKMNEMYSSLIDYIYEGDEAIIDEYFNEKEVMHMSDVHKLFKLNSFIALISSIVLLVFSIYVLIFILKDKDKNIIATTFVYIRKYFFVILSIFILLMIIISFDFNSAFIKFHELFFDNDLWLLDPRTDIMIRMLPQDFFMKMAIRIGLRFGIYLIIDYILISSIIKLYKE